MGSDREAVETAYHLLRNDGLFIGPSAALNVVGAVKLARRIAEKHGNQPEKQADSRPTVVTVICDGGDRYQSKMWTKSWLEEKQLVPRNSAAQPSAHPDGLWFID